MYLSDCILPTNIQIQPEAVWEPKPIFGLVKMVAWPDLTVVPTDMLEPVSRVCALLCRTPAASFVIDKRTHLSKQQVERVLSYLAKFNCIKVFNVQQNAQLENEQDALATFIPQPELADRVGLIAKLWTKFLDA